MDYEFTEADAKQDARIIEQLQARVKELEADRLAISTMLDNEAIEHSGFSQAGRAAKLAENYRNRGRMLVQKQLRVRELERCYDDMLELRNIAVQRSLKAEAVLNRIALDADRRGIGGDAITIDLLTAGAGALE